MSAGLLKISFSLGSTITTRALPGVGGAIAFPSRFRTIPFNRTVSPGRYSDRSVNNNACRTVFGDLL